MSLTSLSGGAAGLMIKKAGATAYATLSSADADTKDSPNKPTLSNSDLTATASSTGEWNLGRSTLGFTTGKWYWEVKAYRTGGVHNGGGAVGVAEASAIVPTAASGNRLGEANSSSWTLGLNDFKVALS